MFTAALYVNLACSLHHACSTSGPLSAGSRLLCYAYGSGAMASVYVLRLLQDSQAARQCISPPALPSRKLDVQQWRQRGFMAPELEQQPVEGQVSGHSGPVWVLREKQDGKRTYVALQ
jgi:3-hydroxy-3-methylglutaryl CoA synthase